MATRVLVVQPNRIVRRGICAELVASGASVVAEVESGTEAVAAAVEHRPDVVLLDSRLPEGSGAEVCAAILKRQPGTAVIVLSAERDERAVEAALDSGARGFLVTDAEDLDLGRAIERVLAGESVIDPRAAAVLIDAHRTEEPKLSGQELSVVRLVAEGLTNPEVGERLHLSRHTVKEYLSHAMRKLDAGNRIEAVRKAAALGLIDGVGPSSPADPASSPDTVVYNDEGGPILSSELKVTPFKIDKLERSREPHDGSTNRDT
jgi:two-component system, NarL family, response regulator DevR